MTEPVATGYATVDDFELLTGLTVPAENEAALQANLDANSDLVKLYLGDCEPPVAAAWPDVLTTLVVNRTNRMIQQPTGLSSASVGSTSVSYARGAGESAWLSEADTAILDRLMLNACPSFDVEVPGVGELGVGWGGPAPEDVDSLWVLTGPARKQPR